LAARIAAALPQTQCTRCGYPDCEAYAQAIAGGAADINQCPPGGAEGVALLSAITGKPVVPLSADHGEESPRSVAVIDEDWCIGCTLCLAACPTDAIVGANKVMHTVIEDHCTGCALCLPVCPVDCIALVNVSGIATGWQAWSSTQADRARQRYETRKTRLAHEQQAAAVPVQKPGDTGKQTAIDAALARARARRQT
jgi:electron transport complex protein RnfB